MAHPNPRILIPLALIGALGIGGWIIERQRAEKRSALSGYFESQPAEVASRLGGRVIQLRVEEGDAIRAGQSLVVFEAEATKEETAAQEAQARQAQARLREVENGPRREDIARQEAVVAEARAQLALLRNGPLPESIRAAQWRLKQAEAQLHKAQAGPRPQEIAQLRAAKQAARARQAQVERGLTAEERAQAKARLDAALAQENLARAELARMTGLYRQGALSRQAWERFRAEQRTAEAKREEMEQAYRRAEEGAPPEERAQARAMHRQAQAALDLALAGTRPEDIEAARYEVRAARENLNLLRRGTRPEELRAAEARLAQARAALAELRSGSRREQIAQARAARQAAAATARSARERLSERIIRATEDGIVERLLIAVGDLVSPGDPVARIARPRDIWLRIYVPEAQLAKVTVGSEAVVKVDGIAEPIPALVESIATHGEFTPANLQTPDERGKQVFAVRLRLEQPDPRVKAGMFATVRRLGDWTP